MRQLTKYFGSYSLAQYEKKTGKGIMDLVSMDGFEITKLATLIMLGNRGLNNEEEAYVLLDDYLKSDEDHSLISAFFDLLDELDMDIKIFKSTGLNISDIKKEYEAEAKKAVNALKKETPDEHLES